MSITTTKRRTLGIAPVAVALVLSVAACGGPAANSSAASSGTLSNASAGSTANAAGSGTSGSSDFGASGGSATGGSAAPGQVGVSSGNSTAASGMTPDQVAAYCTGFPYDPTIVEGLVNQDVIDGWTGLRKVTPVQLVPNVDVMVSDYQAIRSEKRIYAQLKDELVANYTPLHDLQQQICVAH
jgi:hypothetical protein